MKNRKSSNKKSKSYRNKKEWKNNILFFHKLRHLKKSYKILFMKFSLLLIRFTSWKSLLHTSVLLKKIILRTLLIGRKFNIITMTITYWVKNSIKSKSKNMLKILKMMLKSDLKLNLNLSLMFLTKLKILIWSRK